MLQEENIDVMFLSETDTVHIKSENDYRIVGYSIIHQKREQVTDKLRLICLFKVTMEKNIVIRNDLMSSNLPSIWLEYKEPNKEALLIGGFYREWNHKGDTTEAGQVKRMEELSTQLERISEEKKSA